MKITAYKSIATLLLPAILLISSCAKDDTTGPGADDRDKYVGTWSCKETPAGQASVTFTIDISKAGESDTLVVNNFNQLGGGTSAIFLVAGNSITIPTQSITAVVVSGSGFYSSDKLNLNYSADSDQLTAVCTRQ